MKKVISVGNKKGKKRKEYDKKIFRLLSILNKLNADGKVCSAELANDFCVSMRSIQRDLELLAEVGFPLMSSEKGTHTFMEGFSLRRASVTNEQASLLAFLYEIAKSLGKKFEESFNGILKKVLAEDTESAFYAKMPDGVKLDPNTPFVKEIESAIEETARVEFYYLKDGQERWFRVDPLKIAFFDGFWYLICRVQGKDWILKLRLENIRKLKVLDSYFTIPKNLKTMLNESVSIWFAEKRDKKIVVSVDKDAARFFKKKVYLPCQKITKENKDGSLIIESMVCQHMEVIPVVQRWIPHAHIIEPKKLREEINGRIRSYIK